MLLEKIPQYEILFLKANSDLRLAIRAFELHDSEIDTATILFHFQQAAEKFLKVLLAYNQIHFEKIHDITELVSLCRNNKIELPDYIENFVYLNPFAVIGRYDIISEDDLSGTEIRELKELLGLFKNNVAKTIGK